MQELVFTGFYSFTAPEQAVIRTLSGRVELTIALAQWSGAQPTIDAFSSLHPQWTSYRQRRSSNDRTLCIAPLHRCRSVARSHGGFCRRMRMAGHGARWASSFAVRRTMFRRFARHFSDSVYPRDSTSRLRSAMRRQFGTSVRCECSAQRLGPRRDFERASPPRLASRSGQRRG